MPLIAYQRAHGATDYPHHFAFFEEARKRGILDRYDFALDCFMDPSYCRELVERFPELSLAIDHSLPRRLIQWLKQYVGRGYRYVACLDKFDAACEAPGGRLNPIYSGNLSAFWLYPRVRRTAILFHSLESGILNIEPARRSIERADLVVARTTGSADVARRAGARHVIESSDVVLNMPYREAPYETGYAVALRLPNLSKPAPYLDKIRRILDRLECLDHPVDHVRIEEPIGEEMTARGYNHSGSSAARIFAGNDMYKPFERRRDAIISCRLHTTLISLLHGNRRILQFQIEDGTQKLHQFKRDLGLADLPMLGREDLTLERIEAFLDNPTELSQEQVELGLSAARTRAQKGFDALEEWLESL